MRKQDEARVAPGADEIIALLAEGPNLILLDEVLQYLISAGGVKIHQTTLRDETFTFLQRLTAAVSNMLTLLWCSHFSPASASHLST